MQKTKPDTKDMKRHPGVQRDTMEDIKDLESSTSKPARNEVKYKDPNRDRALGEADRTGRHFDEETE